MKKLMILAAALMIGACTSDLGTDDYTTQSVGSVGAAKECRVITTRKIKIRNDNNAGMMLGGAAGGVAGSMIGGNTATNMLGAIGGAVVGGLAGEAAQDVMSDQSGYEYVVELRGGGVVTVTQGDNVVLQPGERCLLLYGARSRLIPYASSY